MGKLFNSRSRDLNAKQKMNIVFCMFGSLINFDSPRSCPYSVARELNMLPQTVWRQVKRLRRLNYNMIDFLKKRPGRPREIIGSEQIEKRLLSSDCLRRWTHLSISKRCAKIK